MDAKTYRDTHNEGGEGYNPYAKQVAAEIEAQQAAVRVRIEERIQYVVDHFAEYAAAWAVEQAKHVTAKGLPFAAIAKIEQAVGVRADEMRMAKARRS